MAKFEKRLKFDKIPEESDKFSIREQSRRSASGGYLFCSGYLFPASGWGSKKSKDSVGASLVKDISPQIFFDSVAGFQGVSEFSGRGDQRLRRKCSSQMIRNTLLWLLCKLKTWSPSLTSKLDLQLSGPFILRVRFPRGERLSCSQGLVPTARRVLLGGFHPSLSTLKRTEDFLIFEAESLKKHESDFSFCCEFKG